MNKEFASGAVVFSRENGMFLFLVIYSARNRAWGFPKGHREPGESETQTAAREIAEETGLKEFRLMNGFREEDIYEAISSSGPNRGQLIEKHSVYYLCETKDRNVTVDGDEISDHRWLGFQDALSILTFESARSILRKALSFLENLP